MKFLKEYREVLSNEDQYYGVFRFDTHYWFNEAMILLREKQSDEIKGPFTKYVNVSNTDKTISFSQHKTAEQFKDELENLGITFDFETNYND